MARLAGEVCRVPLLAGAVVARDGLVVTAAHVIAGAEGDLAVRLPDGTELAATVVGFDPERDLAALAVPGLSTPPVALAPAVPDSEARIVTMDRADAMVSIPAGVRREITAGGEDIYGEGDVERQAVELEADVTRGMSGAGAFDGEGRLLGIVFAESRGRGITYAVAASEIEAFLAGVDQAAPVGTGPCLSG